MRRGVVKDKDFYAAWNAAHDYCHCCGIAQHLAPSDYGGVGISTHHVVKSGRSDEACNLLRLCGRCHDLAEGHTIRRPDRTTWPKLSLAVCLSIKLVRDPDDFDPVRLAALFGRRLPDALPIPDVFEESYRARRPWDVRHYQGGFDVQEIIEP